MIVPFIFLEIFLRVFNPIPTRIKGDKIILPVNKKHVIENITIPGIDKTITQTINSLGFRGPEKPVNFSNYLSIITVGGSTTECAYQSDDKTWSFLLEKKLKKVFRNIWLNNAGLDGHSTFGHQILMDDYLLKIKPKIVMFLIGVNDVGRDDLNNYDKDNIKNIYASFSNFFTKNSEVINLIVNMYRGQKAIEKGISHCQYNINTMDSLTLAEDVFKKALARHNNYIEQYKKRLIKLIHTAKLNGIEPILITEPKVWGIGIDTLTGINLENRKLSDNYNSKLDWQILELYNHTTKKVGLETQTIVIDLAEEMPKSSRYYYDALHYTNAGAERVSEIIFNDLVDHFKTKYKSFLITQ